MDETVAKVVRNWWDLSEYSGELNFNSAEGNVKFILYTRDNKYKFLIDKDRIMCGAYSMDGEENKKLLADESFSKASWDKIMQLITQNECIITVPAEVPGDSVTPSDETPDILIEAPRDKSGQLMFNFMVI